LVIYPLSIFNDGHSKVLELYLFEDFETQPRKLKILFARYLENATNINYPLSLYEVVFLSFSIQIKLMRKRKASKEGEQHREK